MLVFGDLACPNKELSKRLFNSIKELRMFDEDDVILGNLEGVIVPGEFSNHENKLYNSQSILEIFRHYNTIFSIANNHMYDYPEKIQYTLNSLTENNIAYVGLTDSKNNNIPKELNVNGSKYIVFAHCWNVMTRIVKNDINEYRISDSNYQKLIQDIKEKRNKSLDTKIVVYLHWNFDLEKLPFPAHRSLARELIDAGANAVIGSHSHCVNGGEIYKDGLIVYGLGNFYIPDSIYFDGKLDYPKHAHTMLILDIKDNVKDSVCYWYEVESNQNLTHRLIKKENFVTGELINRYSPYRNMNNEEYMEYFRENREKSLLVPIWKNHHNNLENHLKDNYIVARINTIRIIKKLLNKW